MIPARTVFCQLHQAIKSHPIGRDMFHDFRVKPFTGSTNFSHKRFQLAHFAVYFAQLSCQPIPQLHQLDTTMKKHLELRIMSTY